MNRGFYVLPTSGILTTSVNTPSQTVGDFYDVIRRIGSISTWVHSRQSPTSAIFTVSVNMKFASLRHRTNPRMREIRTNLSHSWVCSMTQARNLLVWDGRRRLGIFMMSANMKLPVRNIEDA